MEVMLNVEEAEALRDVLAGYLSDLHLEVASTDRGAFRRELRRREAMLTRLLEEVRRSIEGEEE